MPPVSAFTRRVRRILLPFVAGLALAACPDGVQWSAQDKANARYIVRSLAATERAAQLVKELDARRASQAERDVAAAAWRAALVDALQVNDTVLTKAHRDLPRRWRQHYQRSLAELAEHYRSGGRAPGAASATRLNDFLRWYSATQPEFRWWRGGPGE
jgi:hypothetical protein